MAVEAGTLSDDDSPKIKFVRYLYIGKEYPVYHSGTWAHQNHFLMDQIPSAEQLAADKETELFPIERIKHILDTKSVERSETLMFALAACARQEKSMKLRQAAYNFIAEKCKNPEDFMLFISFVTQLSRQSIVPKHGWGHGLRSAAKRWYLSRDAVTLAENVTKYKSRHGWKHKDIIKLSHPVTKAVGPDVQAVLKYITYGLDKTKLDFENESKAIEVIQLIERTEDFRQCDDPVRAAGLIRTWRYTIDHLNSHLMKSPEVWEALIETMNLSTLIENLQKIYNLGLLTPNSHIIEKLINIITDKSQIIKSKIRPAVILIAAKNFEDPDRVPVCAKRKVARKNKLKNRQLPMPDKRIVDALYSALNISFANVEPTGLRYLITVSTDGWRKKQMTQPTSEVNKGWIVEAACVVTLSLLRSDEKVTISAFTAVEGLNARPVYIDKNATFLEAVEKLRPRPAIPSNSGKPILWAAHHRRKYDVFINVVDKMREKYDFTARAMDLYKKKMNLPKTRLVNWVVGSTSTYMESKHVSDILTICGFDVHTPKIIEAFAKHQF